MKKFISLILMLLTLAIGQMWGAAIHTLDFTAKTASNSSYNQTYWTYGSWSVNQCANNNGGWGYVRCGGKGGSANNSESTLTSNFKGPKIESKVGSIVISHNGRNNSNVTNTSVTITAYSNSTYTTSIWSATRSSSTISISNGTADTIQFTGLDVAKDSYYIIAITSDIKGKSNYGVDIKKVEFYAPVTCTSLTMSTVTATPGNAQIALSWPAVTSASSYTVSCKVKSSGAAAGTAGSVTGTTTKSCTISGLSNGVEYTWSVEPVGSGTYCSSNTPATGDATPNQTRTITYYDKDGSHSTTLADGTNIANALNALYGANSPTSCDTEDYEYFVGWKDGNISGTASNVTLLSTEVVNAASESKSYYAVWSDTEPADYSTTYTSNVTLPSSGTNASSASLNIGSTSGITAVKLGKSGEGGSGTFSIPSGTTKIYLHAAGWNGKSATLTLSTSVGSISPSNAQDLTSNTGVANNSPFTLATPLSNDFFEYTLSGVTSAATITLETGSERGVIWGVNAVSGNGNANYITTCCSKLGQINGSVSLSQTTAALEWADLDHVSSWAVQYKEHSAENWNTWNGAQATADSKRSVTITSLSCGTAYDFKIAATGESGYCDAEDVLEDQSTSKWNISYTLTNTVDLLEGPAQGANACGEIIASFTKDGLYTFPEEITVTIGGNAATVDVDYLWDADEGELYIEAAKVTGDVAVTIAGVAPANPIVTPSPSALSFAQVKKGAAVPAAQDIAITGHNLTDDLTVTSSDPTLYVVSLKSGSLTPDGNKDASPVITVTPQAGITSTAGDKDATITISDGGLDEAVVVNVTFNVQETYTVNFYINSLTTPTGDPQTDVAGTALTVPTVNVASINDCADADYEFMGWTNTNNYIHGTSDLIINTAGLAIGNADVNYYAVFALKEGEDGYAKVTAVNQLTAGDKIVITGVNNTDYYGMKVWDNTKNNFQGASIAISDGVITALGDACELTLGGTENTWTFYDGTYYLYSAGSAKTGSGYNNYMRGKTEVDDACKWTIEIDNEEVTSITSNTNTATPHMRFNYNNGSPLFSCYNNTNQSAVTLYKKVSATYSNYRLVCPHAYIVALSPATNGNGTISFAKNASAITEIETTGENDVTVDVVAAPATGYELSNVALSGIGGASYNAGVITLPANTEGTLTATATFSKANYAVTYTAPSNGNYTIKVGDAAAVSANTTAQYGQTITLAVSPDEGYQFIGWTVTKTASSTTIAVDGNNQFTMPAEAVTVAANFQAIPSDPAEVTFNAGAGELVCNDCTNGKLTEESAGAGITLPSCTPATGYAFLGWTATQNKTTIDDGAVSGATYLPAADITLYAVYAQLTAVTLKKGNGTTTDEVLYADVTTGKVTLPSRSSKNQNYTFAGWSTKHYSTEQEDANPSILAAGEYTPGNDITLYPVFSVQVPVTIWTKKTVAQVDGAGTYAIIDEDGYAFNGTMSSGHGQHATNTFSFTNNVATSAPTGTCELTFTVVEGGYTLYNEDLGYLYATKASSGGLSWHAEESSYWKISADNWLYNSNSAYLRVYNHTFRTYAGDSNNDLYFAKKESQNVTKYNAAPANDVASPTFSPAAGAYYGAQDVTIDCTTNDVTIYYTDDESVPDENSTEYTTTFSVSSSKTIKAVAIDEDGYSSTVAEAAYTIYPIYNSIAAYQAASAQEAATARVLIDKNNADAIVIGVVGSYSYIQDGTAALVIKRPSAESPWTVGAELDGYVQGTRSTYYGLPMITVEDIEHVSTSVGTPVSAQTVSNLDFAGAWSSYAGNLIKVEDVYFQAQATENRTVALADGNSNSGAIYDALFKLNAVDLPMTATACDVTGVLVAKTENQVTTYYIAPTKAEDITTNGALAFLNVSPVGGLDAEHAVGVAPNGQVTVTPVEGFATTLGGEAITSISNVTIDQAKSITVSSSRTYYETNTKTYYYEVDESYKAITVNQATGGTIGADLTSAVAGTTITLTATPNAHHHFVSWNVTYNDGAEKSIIPNGDNQFQMVDYPVTVTATFAEDLKYTIAFDGNGATSGDVPTVDAKYANTSFTVPGKGDLKKTGATFTGWQVSGVDVAVGSSYTTPVEVPTVATTITFVAQWEDVPSWATVYTSNVTLVGGGESNEEATVVIGEGSYPAIKAGSGKKTGTVSFIVPIGTTAVHCHGFAWNDATSMNVTLAASPEVNNLSQSAFTINADGAGTGSGTYTINTENSDPADQYFSFTFDAVETETEFTFSYSSGDKRFIIYGVNAIYPEITLSPASYDFDKVRANQTKSQEFAITTNANVSGTLSASIIDANVSGKYSVGAISEGKVTVTFDPNGASEGTFTAKLKVAADNAEVTADLTAVVIDAATPEITVDKNAIAFGRVNPNASVSEDIAIGLLHIDGAVSAALSGDDAGKFALSANSFTSDGVLTITSTTSAQGVFSATLTLSATGADDVVIPVSITVASKWATKYTSNVTDLSSDENKKVKVGTDNAEYTLVKANKGSTATFKVPRGTQKIHLHMVAWSTESQSVTITGPGCFTSSKTQPITDNSNLSGTSWSPLTITEAQAISYYYELTPDVTPTAEATITITAASGKRFAIFGVNQEGGVIEVTENTDVSSLGDVEDQPIVASGEGVTLTINVPTVTKSITAKNGATVVIEEETTAKDVIVEDGSKIVAEAETHTPVVHFATTLGSSQTPSTGSAISEAQRIILAAGGEIHYDITLGTSMAGVQADPNQWHAFTVPFPVDVLNGIYDAETGAKLANEVDYAIMDYHGDIRADGKYGWKKYRGTLVPGTFYIMTVEGSVKTFRFKKAATGALPTIDKMQFTAYSGTGADADQGWNGIGNPSWVSVTVEHPVQVLDPYSYEYRTLTAGTVISASTPFFYKASSSSSMTMTESNANVQYAPARTPAKEIKEMAVSFGNEVYKDMLYVTASEDALNTYENEKDLVKMTMSKTPKVAQIFGNAYGMKLSMVNTPLVNNTAEVALELYAPQAGTYTISVPTEREDASLYLTKDGNIIWDLTMSPYEAEFDKGQNNGYGLMLVKKAPGIATGVDEISGEKAGVQKIIINDNVFILRGGKMYDVTGKAVR